MNTEKIFYNAKKYLLSATVGIVNAVFGAGGGIFAVKLFSSQRGDRKQAQASAVCMLLPLSTVSTAFYLYKGYFTPGSALPYIPFGVLGALSGVGLLKRIPQGMLKKLFAAFMIYTGIRMLMR